MPLNRQRRMGQSCLSAEEPERLTRKVQGVLEESSADSSQMPGVGWGWGSALSAAAPGQEPSFITTHPCAGRELRRNQHAQILFPSALGPRATTQNGINWDYGGFGCLAATQG